MNPEEIVRKLAERGAIVHTEATWHVCGLCDASLPVNLEHHKEDCIWRLAKEWADTHEPR